MECTVDNCQVEINVDLNSLNCENNGKSGNDTTSYIYTGSVTCQECNSEYEVTIEADVLDDTGEILSLEYV